MRVALVLVALAMAAPAQAQMPSQRQLYESALPLARDTAPPPRTFVTPAPAGGYTVFTPGTPRTFINRTPGGYTVTAPGHGQTYITRESDDGED